MTCLFCDIPKERIIAMNDLAYAIRDGFPVSKLHTLIIPKRHAIDYFELTKDELLAIHDLIHQLKSFIQEEDPAVIEGSIKQFFIFDMLFIPELLFFNN